jgi:DNA-binding SARP family transcriptional activator/tetratricopeptide (TPR) repeat protein
VRVEFRLLGPLEAWHSEMPVDLGDLQQRYVLAVLLMHVNRSISTERLIECVWRESRPKTNLIPGYIAKLRKTFRDSGADEAEVAIERSPTGYALKVDERRLDSERFTELVTLAATSRSNGDIERARSLLREAVKLWRGRFMEDLSLDLARSEAVMWDMAWADAIGDLAELELEAGNYRWVRDQLRPVVHADPARHRLAALLMRALLATGNDAYAMEVYEGTRAALEERGVAVPRALSRVAGLVQHGKSHNTLPSRPAVFTGRNTELEAIEAAAQQGRSVIWLSGMPGVGKTALAVEAAHQLSDRFPAARLFIALDGYSPQVKPVSAFDALGTLLLDLDVPTEHVPSTLARRTALYRRTLADMSILLVLDGAVSHDQISPLIPIAPGSLVIVTSRSSDSPDGSVDFRLGPVARADAVHLFEGLVGGERLQGQQEQVDEIVVLCGHLPLAIRLVASRFRRHQGWSLDYLVDRLNEMAKSTTEDDLRTGPYAVSYRSLTEPQQALFRLFGLVPGEDLGPAGAAALLDTDPESAQELLDDLHRLSLIEEGEPERYNMPGLTKAFAAALLRQSSPQEAHDALARLLDQYLVTTYDAIAVAFPHSRDRLVQPDGRSRVSFEFSDHNAALQWLATERPNLVAAVSAAADEGFPDHAWQLPMLLWRYLDITGHVQDWTEILELARRAVGTGSTDAIWRAEVLLRLAAGYLRADNPAKAIELAARALVVWEQLDHRTGTADTHAILGDASTALGGHDQAATHFATAMSQYEAAEDQRGRAQVLNALGRLSCLRGDLDDAHQRQLTAVRILREFGPAQDLAQALDSLGSIQQRLGLLAEALASHTEARALSVKTGNPYVRARALNNLATVHQVRGRREEAKRCHAEAMAIAQSVPDPLLHARLESAIGADPAEPPERLVER